MIIGNPPNQISVNDATGNLFNMLNDYCNGVAANIQTAKVNGGALDPVLQKIVADMSNSVPGAAQAKQVAGIAYNALTSTFGAGSKIGRIGTALLFSGNIVSGEINAIKALFSGRTYGFDQYQLATAWAFHVIGKDVGDTNHVTDDNVIQACKWFIDKLGVWISGAQTLTALLTGPVQYMALLGHQPYVTMDLARVSAAVAVRRTYMPDDNSQVGNWANTIGVYDQELVALANQGYGNYQQNLQSVKQSAASGNTDILNGVLPSSSSSVWMYVLIAIIVIIIIILIAKT